MIEETRIGSKYDKKKISNAETHTPIINPKIINPNKDICLFLK